ncbi:hypothetical protein RQP46_004474 [Phenoliferia psychrophenolica]
MVRFPSLSSRAISSLLKQFTPTSDIPTFTLLDGARIPVLGWGNGTGAAKEKAVEAGLWALGSGLRHIDTAQGYNNESTVSSVLSKSGLERDQVWITSKLSQKDGSAELDPIPLDKVREKPDLLLVHNPFVPAPGQIVAFWKILEAMKDAGELTASLGVSNFRPQDFEILLPEAKYKPVCNQLEYHPFVLTHLQPVLDIHAKHNILTTAYGPLTPILRHPTAGGPLKPILQRIANRLGVDEAAVLLLWTKATGVGIITASGNEERIKGFARVQELCKLEVGEEGTLSRTEVEQISEVGRMFHFRGYDEHMSVDFPAPKLPSQ